MINGGTSSSERVLLVEGEDDKHVVIQLCKHISFEPEFYILSKDGIDNVLSSIRNEILVEGRKAVGIVVDANDDLNNRWEKVTERLRNAGIEPTDSPRPGGSIIDGSPRVGIWLMPDNESTGELEDFVQKMIQPEDPVWPRSRRYVDDIPDEHRRFRPGKVLRAQLYAWLATREIPGRMGAAIKAEDLNVDVESSTRFVDWLRELFN